MNQTILHVNSPSLLTIQNQTYKCIIGKNGFSTQKQEGDWTTPCGLFPLREIWYRPDRVDPSFLIPSPLPLRPIQPGDGWCDDPHSPSYNQPIHRPFPSRHEGLWRDDPCYNWVVVLGYNDDPVIPGRGSAIFMHVKRKNQLYTAGCLALAQEDLESILKLLTPNSLVSIAPSLTSGVE